MATAQETLEQRFKAEQADFQQSFQQQWNLTNQRFGPPSQNPRIEEARQRALSSLHQQWAGKANELTRTFKRKTQAMTEVDSLIPDTVKAEETKMRLIEPSDVERVLFPKPAKEADPLKAYGQLHQHEQQVRGEMSRFVLGSQSGTEAGSENVDFIPGEITLAGGRLHNLVAGTTQHGGKGVYVKERQYNEDKKQYVTTHRRATSSEIREWAALKAEQDRIGAEKQQLLDEIRQSDHLAARFRMAAAGSSRMGGTFAQKATTVAQNPKPAPAATAKPVYARKPDTDERVVSYDGGKTWQAVQ